MSCNHKIAIAQDGEHKGLYHCTACHLLVSPYSVSAKFTEIKCLKNEIVLGDEEISVLNTRIAELEAENEKLRSRLRSATPKDWDELETDAMMSTMENMKNMKKGKYDDIPSPPITEKES